MVQIDQRITLYITALLLFFRKPIVSAFISVLTANERGYTEISLQFFLFMAKCNCFKFYIYSKVISPGLMCTKKIIREDARNTSINIKSSTALNFLQKQYTASCITVEAPVCKDPQETEEYL